MKQQIYFSPRFYRVFIADVLVECCPQFFHCLFRAAIFGQKKLLVTN
jgi:hypothetical protein